MTTLVDNLIEDLAKNYGMITPYNNDQLNPASYDVTLGDKILVEKTLDPKAGYEDIVDDRWYVFDIAKRPYILQPNEFVLACTAEIIRIPNTLEAIFCLKSSRGREGWEHALAGYIDPGFHGKVTLELKNNSTFYGLTMTAGMRIGQLRFCRTDGPPTRSYEQTGRYQLDMDVTPSKG